MTTTKAIRDHLGRSAALYRRCIHALYAAIAILGSAWPISARSMGAIVDTQEKRITLESPPRGERAITVRAFLAASALPSLRPCASGALMDCRGGQRDRRRVSRLVRRRRRGARVVA